MFILFLLGNFFFLQVFAEDCVCSTPTNIVLDDYVNKSYSLMPSNLDNLTASNFTYCQNTNCTWNVSYTLQGYVANLNPMWLLANNSLDRLLIQTNDGVTIFDTNNDLSPFEFFYAAEDFTITFIAGSHQGDCIEKLGIDCMWRITMQLVKKKELPSTPKPTAGSSPQLTSLGLSAMITFFIPYLFVLRCL